MEGESFPLKLLDELEAVEDCLLILDELSSILVHEPVVIIELHLRSLLASHGTLSAIDIQALLVHQVPRDRIVLVCPESRGGHCALTDAIGVGGVPALLSAVAGTLLGVVDGSVTAISLPGGVGVPLLLA